MLLRTKPKEHKNEGFIAMNETVSSIHDIHSTDFCHKIFTRKGVKICTIYTAYFTGCCDKLAHKLNLAKCRCMHSKSSLLDAHHPLGTTLSTQMNKQMCF